MNSNIIKYCIESFGGIVSEYKGDIILFFDNLIDDDFFDKNSLNLTKLYESYLENGDKTTFDEFYFTANTNDITLINNNYEDVMEKIINSIQAQKKRSV